MILPGRREQKKMSQAYFQDHFQEYFILLYVALTAYLTVVFSESNGALI